ncbi:MAG TPA: hypothetical protein VG433_05080, partial [Pirellulales bacterium]|nr:hypothetical protein [Pirellulales bacterium]
HAAVVAGIVVAVAAVMTAATMAGKGHPAAVTAVAGKPVAALPAMMGITPAAVSMPGVMMCMMPAAVMADMVAAAVMPAPVAATGCRHRRPAGDRQNR